MNSIQVERNSYFEYTPLWDESANPLPLKVAGAVAAVFANLGKLFANLLIGIGNLISGLFSSDAEPKTPGGPGWNGFSSDERFLPQNPYYVEGSNPVISEEDRFYPSAPPLQSDDPFTPSAPPWDPSMGPYPFPE